MPMAPVIRMVSSIYDQPDAPLALVTFVNVADAEQRSDYADLIRRHGSKCSSTMRRSHIGSPNGSVGRTRSSYVGFWTWPSGSEPPFLQTPTSSMVPRQQSWQRPSF